MVQKSTFAIRMLEKIGAPLVAAIESAPPSGENADIGAAEMMAQMLGGAVKISVSLADSMNVTETEEQADSTRLALASLATPLLADFYRTHKRVPDDNDIKRITKSLEAVIGFAEKFTPAADDQSRLVTMGQDTPFFDDLQASLISMQAMTPAISAISEFSFGQADTKLIQEVGSKLEKEAKQIAGDDKIGQILALKGLAQIYADCHRSEVNRISSENDQSASPPSLDPVWKNFDKRVAMMMALTGEEPAQENNNDVQPQEEPASNPPVVEQKQPTQPQPEKQSEPVADPPQPAQNTAPAAGPMGFFKPGADKAKESAPEQVPTATNTDNKVEPVKQESDVHNAQQAASTPQENSNPMSFFKSPPKDNSDES